MKATCVLTIALAVSGLLSTRTAQSQKVWTLEECIETAKSNNLQVQRQKLQIDASRSNLWSAKAGALPSISGWVTHNLSSGKTVNYENYSYINTQYQDGNMGIQASLPLFLGLEGYHRIRQMKLATLSAEEQAKAIENAITIQVTTGYLQLLLCEELVRVAEDKLQATQQLKYRAEEYFKAGRVARSEVLSMKSVESQDALKVTTAKGNLDLANLVLRQLINLEDDNPIIIQKPGAGEKEIVVPASGYVFEFAKINQPRITSAQYRLKSAEAFLKSKWGAAMPALSLDGYFYSRYSELGVNPLDQNAPYSYKNQLLDNSYGRASINLNIPIVDRLTNRNQISQARIGVMDARLVLDQEQKALREEIQRACIEAESASARLKSAGEAVISAEEAYALVEEQFTNGLVTSVELKVSSSLLLEARADQLQAHYELLLRSAILDFYLGRPVRI